MERRTFITTVASLSAATIAGCTSEGETDDASGSNNAGSNDANAGGSADDSTPEPTDEPTDSPTPEPTDSPTPTEEPTPTATEQPPVTILDHEPYETTLGNIEIRGTVQNTSGEEQSYIGVEAKFFDAEGTRVGDTMWNATDVAPDTKVNFETAMSTTEAGEVDSYELTASTSPF